MRIVLGLARRLSSLLVTVGHQSSTAFGLTKTAVPATAAAGMYSTGARRAVAASCPLLRRRGLTSAQRDITRSRWPRLFCSSSATAGQPEQQPQREGDETRQVDLKGGGGLNKVKCGATADCEGPLLHSNPKIQVLLDSYSRICDEHVPADEPAVRSQQKMIDGHPQSSRSPSRAMFSNNLVDLSRVEVVGFDYDYTLATCEGVFCAYRGGRKNR